MGILENRSYYPDCSHNDMSLDDYYTQDKYYGHFEDDGKAYVIVDRETPRPWMQYLCNDKMFSAVSNTGRGLIQHTNGTMVTKHWEANGNYIIRNPNGERKILVSENGYSWETDFFTESHHYTCTVRQGMMTFEGTINDLFIKVVMFVPLDAPCECWNIVLSNHGTTDKDICLAAVQDLSFYAADQYTDIPSLTLTRKHGEIIGTDGTITSIFTASKTDDASVKKYCDTMPDGTVLEFAREKLSADFTVKPGQSVCWNIVSAACDEAAQQPLVRTFLKEDVCRDELSKIGQKWDRINKRNSCILPDKNLQYFLNFWLKNQIYLTYRFDRGQKYIGYRDGLQDTWGYLLVEPDVAKEKLLLCLSYMFSDGRCPRQFSKCDADLDLRDFSDSPVWAPIALYSYLTETGDMAILDQVIPFLDSEEKSSVEDHIYRALDFLYRDRGQNGLVHMRDGDWADGLAGINKYGADATSVWVTIAAYHAQNLMRKIYLQTGDEQKAKTMERRSDEYKKIVNEVAWDGNWLVYAFFEDGEPIGSHKNLEGKIWLNPQTWGIFTGIIDDPDKIKRMDKAVSKYLCTPFGALVNYPPYVFYGEKCGRLQRQHPGMFLNSSVYNHAASFKVFSDVKRGDYEEALDTISRCLPNHCDNSDTRRTSEPYTVGNVYYGPNHPRYGMNLFSWFTATPSWLIHGGFEEILGVKAGFNGLEITPHVPDDWDGYFVCKEYRGTTYEITFVHDKDQKGIWVDGKKQAGSCVLSHQKSCTVVVRY